MPAAPHLKLVTSDGEPVASQSPFPPPTEAGERLFPVFEWPRSSIFMQVVAASLVIHGAIIAASIDWTAFTEERGAGNNEETIVIEGVDVILLDRMPSVRPPLTTAKTIDEVDLARPLENTQVAAIPPPTAVETAAEVAVSVEPSVETSDTAGDVATAAKEESPIEAARTQAAVAQPTGDSQVAAIEPQTAVERANDIAAQPAQSDKPSVTGDAAATAVTADTPTAAVDFGEARPIEEKAIVAIEALATPNQVPADELLSAPANEETQVSATAVVATATDAPAAAISETEARAFADEVAAEVAPAQDTLTIVSADHLQPADPDQQALVEATGRPEPVSDLPLAVAANAARSDVVDDRSVTAEPVPAPPIPPRRPEIARATPSTPTQPPPAPTASRAANPSAKATAGSGGGKSNGTGKAELASYRSKLVAHLRRHRIYPAAARRRGLQGTASVSFTINRNGRVVAVSLVRRTGHAVLDRASLAMVRRASPFPAIPASIGRSRVTVRAPIRFAVR